MPNIVFIVIADTTSTVVITHTGRSTGNGVQQRIRGGGGSTYNLGPVAAQQRSTTTATVAAVTISATSVRTIGREHEEATGFGLEVTHGAVKQLAVLQRRSEALPQVKLADL